MTINCKVCEKNFDNEGRLKCPMCISQLQKENEKLKADIEGLYHRLRHDLYDLRQEKKKQGLPCGG